LTREKTVVFHRPACLVHLLSDDAEPRSDLVIVEHLCREQREDAFFEDHRPA
jgi:hypothetical protein